MKPSDIDAIRKKYPLSASVIRANSGDNSLAPAPVVECRSENEPVAADEGEVAYKARCLVRIISFRRRLCDERNLYDKHFVDALKEAGAFVDDSPEYVQVQVKQVKVEKDTEERTMLILSPCPK